MKGGNANNDDDFSFITFIDYECLEIQWMNEIERKIDQKKCIKKSIPLRLMTRA